MPPSPRSEPSRAGSVCASSAMATRKLLKTVNGTRPSAAAARQGQMSRTISLSVGMSAAPGVPVVPRLPMGPVQLERSLIRTELVEREVLCAQRGDPLTQELPNHCGVGLRVDCERDAAAERFISAL